MAAVAPPPVWQSDALQNISNGQDVIRGAKGSSGTASRTSYEPAHLSEAYRHVRQVTDGRREADLYDLLANTRREETYQPHFPGWPSVLRPLSPTMFDLPPMVQEKYRACQTMCFCGLFPQIRHAWASIDNSLYLWRYDVSGDVPVEYCGEEQAICAVGLAKPRAGVFLEALQYIIVLCTTTEVVLLGVCLSKPTTLGSLPYTALSAGATVFGAEASVGAPAITLQPLPMYSVPSDNVVMTSVATSQATGRIFLGGSDGHLYELQYASADSWARKRCVKVRITGRLQQLLPSFIPAMLGYGSQGAVDRVLVDDQRHTLYLLTAPGHIQVFDLGPLGKDPAKKVAEVTDFYLAASGAIGGRDVFRNAAAEKKSAAVKHIAVIPMSESTKLHLLAITADGRRVYFTTQVLRSSHYYVPPPTSSTSSGMGPGGLGGGSIPRPTTLLAVFARQALPHVSGTPTRAQGADLGRPSALEVVAAHYSQGTLLLSEAAGSEGRTTKLLLACRNSTLPLASTLQGLGGAAAGGAAAVGVHASHAAGLRELLTELDNCVPGETCAIEAVPALARGLELLPESVPGSGAPGGVPGPHEDLVAQFFGPAPRFVLISTAGVVQLERRRPLDVLAVMLEERSAPQRVASFFEVYGAMEASAMCVALASAPPGTCPTGVVEAAAACLDNTALVGEARMPQDVPQAGGVAGMFAAGAATGAGGIYMGQAVNPHPEPDWSPGHRGLCLYVVRLLSPVWEVRLLAATGVEIPGLQSAGTAAVGGGGPQHRQGAGSSTTHTPRAALEALAVRLRLLDVYLGGTLARRQQHGTLARYRGMGVAPASMLGAGYAGGDSQEDAAVSAAKRQRLVAASLLEDERIRRLRGLVGKASQALTLLGVLEDNNLGRIALALPEPQRKQLADLTLRDLVCEVSGEALATQLISTLVSQQLDATTSGGNPVSGVEAVAAQLQRLCPAFFKEEDRLFYQASAQLKAAERLPPGPDRDGQVKAALKVMRRVPGAANLDALCSQLAYLKAYGDMLEVPLAAAALADPSNAALRPPELSGPDAHAARQRRRDAYRPALDVLRALCTGQGNPAQAAAQAAGAPPEQAAAPLPAPERSAGQAALLKACLAAPDTFFLSCLFGAMVDMGEAASLLEARPPQLQQWLAEEAGVVGGLAAAMQGAEPPPVGPLTSRQYELAGLLAKLLVNQGCFREAAGVYKCLAVRRTGPGAHEVPLAQRVACLQSAVLQAHSVGDSVLVTGLEADARLMALQAGMAQRVQALRSAFAAGDPAVVATVHAAAAVAGGGGEGSSGHGTGGGAGELLARLEAELTAGPLDVTALYNDVAQPLRLWDVCLQLVDFAGSSVPAALVRQLWDHALLAAWEQGDAGSNASTCGNGTAAAGAGGGAGQGAGGRAPLLGRQAGLVGPSQLVERLVPDFQPASAPLVHVVFRLVQMACGRWPQPSAEAAAAGPSAATAAHNEEVVARTTLAACQGSVATAMRTYEVLLSRRAPDVPEAELAPLPLRLALLRCLSQVCGVAAGELGASLVAPGLAPSAAMPASVAASAAALPGLAPLPGVLVQREASGLAEACERYALEARRLGTPEAAELADSFVSIRRGLLHRLTAAARV